MSGAQQRPRVALAINPTSGKGRGRKLGQRVAQLLQAAGVDLVHTTGDSAEATAERSREAVSAGVDALVVVGGDGMVNLGVNICAGGATALGIVAAGSGNDVAASLGLPSHDPAAAVRVICAGLAGSLRKIDAVRRVGPGQPQWFVGVLGGGFDAKVNERANGWSWPRGKLRYDLAIVRELPVFRPLPYLLELDGESWTTEAMLVAVGNTTRYGGGMQITPDAELDDGLLDVLVVGRVSILELLRVFPKVFSGQHLSHPAVTVRRARRVRLSTPNLMAYADGERFGSLPLEVEVVPGALTVLVPSVPHAHPVP